LATDGITPVFSQMTELTSRELLVHLYETLVDSVDGRLLVQQWSRDHPSAAFTHCIAVGKAALPMLQGALDSWHTINSALLIVPGGGVSRDIRRNKKVTVIASSHPVPDQSSLDAGCALTAYLSGLAAGESLLALVSGGASSLVEVPAVNVSLAELQAVNEHLLASGKDIHTINAWRRQFSVIKGGGLLQYVQHLKCTQLTISDVYGNDPAVIGSGLLVSPDNDKRDDDSWLQSLLPEETEKTEPHKPVETHVIGSLEVAMQAAVDEAVHQGLDHYLHDEFIRGDAVKQGRAIGHYLLDAPPGIHVWGGETTVELPDNPGLGGRNQSMALSLAIAIDGSDDLSVLVAGTDGIDGNTPCAGAIVSGGSIQQARQMGFDVEAELAKANAGMVLMAIGDLFKPGPTNTNVMDVIIAYKRC
jgi:hydroxypyruvate reductase